MFGNALSSVSETTRPGPARPTFHNSWAAAATVIVGSWTAIESNTKSAWYRWPSARNTPVWSADLKPTALASMTYGPPTRTFSRKNRPPASVMTCQRAPLAGRIAVTTAPETGELSA